MFKRLRKYAVSPAIPANSGDIQRPTAAASKFRPHYATRHDTGDFAWQASGRRFESAMLHPENQDQKTGRRPEQGGRSGVLYRPRLCRRAATMRVPASRFSTMQVLRNNVLSSVASIPPGHLQPWRVRALPLSRRSVPQLARRLADEFAAPRLNSHGGAAGGLRRARVKSREHSTEFHR